VIAVVFVVVPALTRAEPAVRAWMLRNVFPRIFRLASVLIAMTWVGGAGLYLSMNRWRIDPGALFGTRWGRSILVGGTLGLLLGLFHFFVEDRLENAAVRAGDDPALDEGLVRRLRVIPRVGLGVLVVVIGSMMYAARGL
jgi:hypothetical protein